MKTLTIAVQGGSYAVHVGGGLLGDCGRMTRETVGGKRAFIVTDENVSALYGRSVAEAYEKAGYQVESFVIPPGEASKSPQMLFAMWESMVNCGIQRSDVAVALGGGVVGDLCGFGAATYLRGIPFVQLPTSLLSQIDSSIGGKVAVDLPQGKNLVGNFYQPKLVLCDTDALCTLSDAWFYDGAAEAVKCGLIADESLFALLEKAPTRTEMMANIETIVTACLQVKKHVVEQDEFDRGERMKLNFGHTFGHAIEAGTGYTLSHGHGVAAGMVLMCAFGEEVGITPSGILPRVRGLIKAMNLPQNAQMADAEAMEAALVRDKKSGAAGISAVILTDVGDCILHTVPAETLSKWLTDHREA